MNILFLIWSFRPGEEGGAERQARRIATALSERGHRCTVWTARQEGGWPLEEECAGVRIRRLGCFVPLQNRARRVVSSLQRVIKAALGVVSRRAAGSWASRQHAVDFWLLLPWVWATRLCFMRAVRRELHDVNPRPDLIHLHEPSWLGGFAVELAAPFRIPVLCQEATRPALPVLGYDVPGRHRLEAVRRRADFIAMAPYLARELLDKGVEESHIRALPNGVAIPPVVADPARSRRVLYVGNFSQGSHWKAFDILFSAWAQVHACVPDARLVLVGGGDSSAWQSTVEQSGCSGSVEFVGRVADPASHYQSAAMLVLPSRVEGMSNALLEAQSWGLPCVVSDIPGNCAVVEQEVNGLVVPVNDSEALGAAVVRLLDHGELRAELGRGARRRAERDYDINSVTDRLVEIYSSVTSRISAR